jgi:hypothetical protein
MEDRVHRMRTLQKKGRNMYAAFFAELSEVRKEIGGEELQQWCFRELHISLSFILDWSKLLLKDDERRVRAEFARAKEAEKAAKLKIRAAAVDNKTDNSARDNKLITRMLCSVHASPSLKNSSPALITKPVTKRNR